MIYQREVVTILKTDRERREMCLALAKRNIVDNIYRSAKLEGINTTYVDTERIYEGMVENRASVNDVLTIVNLKHAWWLILETLGESALFNFVCQINKEIGNRLFPNPGTVRKLPVRIGGTSWTPSVPEEDIVRFDLLKISQLEDNLYRALSYLSYMMRTQAFLDGNKRTAMLIANKILIESGIGILTVPVELIPDFKIKTIHMYETGNTDEFYKFITDKCIEYLPEDF